MKADLHANPPIRVGADEFGPLKAIDIRALVVGRDITDEQHTVEYYRQDGVLVVTDFGSGDELERDRGSVANDKLCNTYKAVTLTKCFKVWHSGGAVSLRLREQDRPALVYVREHKRR